MKSKKNTYMDYISTSVQNDRLDFLAHSHNKAELDKFFAPSRNGALPK